jgi:hypothetical protein
MNSNIANPIDVKFEEINLEFENQIKLHIKVKLSLFLSKWNKRFWLLLKKLIESKKKWREDIIFISHSINRCLERTLFDSKSIYNLSGIPPRISEKKRIINFKKKRRFSFSLRLLQEIFMLKQQWRAVDNLSVLFNVHLERGTFSIKPLVVHI